MKDAREKLSLAIRQFKEKAVNLASHKHKAEARRAIDELFEGGQVRLHASLPDCMLMKLMSSR